jgi:hypothetical protein
MKNEIIPMVYTNAKKEGRVEFAQLDYKRNSAVRKMNLLRALERANVTIPDMIRGTEIDKLISEAEAKGITIPAIRCSDVEERSISEAIKNAGFSFEDKTIKYLTPSQLKSYRKFLSLKNKK